MHEVADDTGNELVLVGGRRGRRRGRGAEAPSRGVKLDLVESGEEVEADEGIGRRLGAALCKPEARGEE